MHDEVVRGFIDKMLDHEVIPTLSGELDKEDLRAFAAAVKSRLIIRLSTISYSPSA